LPSNSNGLGDRADGEGADLLLRDLGDHRGGAGTGAATLAAGDEDHVGALEGVLDFVPRLGRRARTDLGVGARAESLGQVVTDADLDVRVSRLQRLRVGVHGDELDATQARVDHSTDGIGATAADSDDLDHCQIRSLHLLVLLRAQPPIRLFGPVESRAKITHCQRSFTPELSSLA
jgi:hypothetical protein